MPLKGDKRHPVLPRANKAVADILRDSILEGEIEPGERVKEEDIASALGVSRTPVREALLVLAAERLVDLPANRGARPRVRVLEDQELATIYDLRMLLEAYAAARAAQRIRPEDVRRLEESCKRLAATPMDELVAVVSENRSFHRIILEIADSERLEMIVDGLLQVPLAYKAEAWAKKSFRKLSLAGHRRIVAALKSGDPEGAAEAMRRHLAEVTPDLNKRS